MSDLLAIALDAENSDPAWGAAEDAAFMIFGEDGEKKVEVPVYDLIEAARALVDSHSNDGCSEDLTVVERAILEHLDAILKKIRE